MSNASSLLNGGARTGNSTLADLTSAVRRTEGDRPPPLVGCSITLVGDSIYVFGGRLVPTRTMVSTLYCLSLRTLIWTLLSPTNSPSSPPNSLTPAPRYFHSADVWGKKLVIYGGEGYSPLPLEGATELSPLCTQGDICIWDTETNSWQLPEPNCAPGVEPPASRYAHLGVVSTYLPSTTDASRTPFSTTTVGEGEGKERSMLIIIGGQNLQNTYLHSVNVLDLEEMKWVKEGNWEKNIGTYRAVAASPKYRIAPSGSSSAGTTTNENGLPRSASTAFPTPPSLPPASPSRTRPGSRPTTPSPLATSSIAGELGEANLGLSPFESLSHLSYSELPTQEKPEPILVFSNFNFTDVRRDLDFLSSPTPPTRSLDTTPLSKLMTGLALPPGLRFPTGTIIGRHLLIFGTFLSQNINNFSIWAMDLGRAGAGGTMEGLREGEVGVLGWMRVDPGMVLSKGSWNRAVGWGNCVVVLGDRERDIALDYDHRQTNFAHVAFVDTEAFGIYQPPPQPLSLAAQSLGLATLSHPHLSDFEIICSDGVRLACSRKLLLERWSWFAELVKGFEERSKEVTRSKEGGIDGLDKDKVMSNGSGLLDVVVEESESTEPNTPVPLKTFAAQPSTSPNPKLTPRTLFLPSPSPLVQAFLQYLYTHALSTPLQLSLPILSSLLLFSKTYKVDNLRALVVHALHEALSSVGWTAAAVYEAATLGGATALQIRALKMMMGGTRTGPRSAGGNS